MLTTPSVQAAPAFRFVAPAGGQVTMSHGLKSGVTAAADLASAAYRDRNPMAMTGRPAYASAVLSDGASTMIRIGRPTSSPDRWTG